MICSEDGEKFQFASCTQFSGASVLRFAQCASFSYFFAAVLKKRHLDSTWLTQGPTWHHQMREST
jgi:hypothetical protein